MNSLITTLLLSAGLTSAIPTQPLPRADCTTASFTLHNITFSANYIYSTPAHLATSSGTISFNLSNSAVPYTTSCTGTCHDYPGVYCTGWEVFQCTNPAGVAAGDGASFSFIDSGNLNVTQNWGCGTSEVTGNGAGVAKLQCSEDVWTNPSWSSGQLYQTSTTTCQPAELLITPVVTGA